MATIPQSAVSNLFDELLLLAERMALRAARGLPDGSEDVVQAARIALFTAATRFSGDPVAAQPRCLARVRGAILDELRRRDPLSQHCRARLRLLRTAAGDLEAALGRAPSDPEIGAYCGISSRQILELEALSAAANTISSQDGDWFAAAADPDADSPVAVAEASDRARALQAAMGRLPDRYSFVLRRYYFDGATLDLIAGQLGVTKVRVQQLRTQAELRLRADPDLLVELDHQ